MTLKKADKLNLIKPILQQRFQHCKEKGTVKDRIPTEGGEQEVLLINEPNVYRLIIKSQLPAAEAFETWLFEEVVPSIRKKGFYGKFRRTFPKPRVAATR